MNKKSFYEVKIPEEAMNIYLKSHQNLYDDIKVFTIKKILNHFYKNFSGLEILEIGSAGGIWTKYFLEKGAMVTCVEIFEPILKANQKQNPEASFVLGDATDIKINKKFDFIFVKDVIEHIKGDEKFLSNMNDHLKSNGLILINTQNNFSVNYLIQKSYHLLKRNKNWFGWDPTHLRFYNPISLKRKLNLAGLKPLKWFSSYYFPYRILAERLKMDKIQKIFCLIELINLYNKFPFSLIGWSLGVIAKKSNLKYER